MTEQQAVLSVGVAIVAALEARKKSNETAATIHPDAATRAEAKVRASAYENAINDVRRIVERASIIEDGDLR